MKSNSQRNLVIARLRENGSVSRNWCLERYISRLGAIICDLTKEGWEFKAEYKEVGAGKDYVYTLVKSPEDKDKLFTYKVYQPVLNVSTHNDPS